MHAVTYIWLNMHIYLKKLYFWFIVTYKKNVSVFSNVFIYNYNQNTAKTTWPSFRTLHESFLKAIQKTIKKTQYKRGQYRTEKAEEEKSLIRRDI